MNTFIDTIRLLPEKSQKVILNARISRIEKMRDSYNQKIGIIICNMKKTQTLEKVLLIKQNIIKLNLIIEQLDYNLNSLYDYYAELYEQEEVLCCLEENMCAWDKAEYYADF